MKFERFKRSLSDATSSNRNLQIILVLLALGVVLLAWRNLNPVSRVIIQPYTLTDPAWVERDSASSEYKEAFSLFLAMLLGNVSPGNLEFVRERIDPLLTSSVRQEVLNTLADQAQTIRTENVSVSFVPNKVHYESKTQKYFVEGRSTTTGPNGGTEEERRTFEFKYKVEEYIPRVEWLNNYAGVAWSQKRLQMKQARAENAK